MKKLFLTVLFLISLCTNLERTITVKTDSPVLYSGFAGYVTSTSELQSTINLMSSMGLNVYRVSFNPPWKEGAHSYNAKYIDYLLKNSNFLIIVDPIHLYPPIENSSQMAKEHLSQWSDRLFQVLSEYANNSRVAVELVNEYVSSDYNTRMQTLITNIRNAKYTNMLIINKWETAWYKFNDPFNNTYQGYHYYFNDWSPSKAIRDLEKGLALGIKIINTEIGANSEGHRNYNQTTVNEVKIFLNQSLALNVSNILWMDDDSENWQTYSRYGLSFNGNGSITSSEKSPLEGYLIVAAAIALCGCVYVTIKRRKSRLTRARPTPPSTTP